MRPVRTAALLAIACTAIIASRYVSTFTPEGALVIASGIAALLTLVHDTARAAQDL